MDLQFLLAKVVGKTVLALLRLQNRGGTALPGLWALKIDPQFVRKASRNLRSIVVTGTNGKTTTARLIATILQANGSSVIHNRSGSNLLRGIASTLLEKNRADYAIFEADEAAFTEIVTQTKPKVILLLNLFRDQMDRYGEIDTTAKQWAASLANLPEDTTIVVNADDPALGYLASKLKHAVTFGLDDRSLNLKKLPHAVDSIFSPETGVALSYTAVFLSHLGIYADKTSEFKRPPLDISIPVVIANSLTKTQFKLSYKQERLELDSTLPGTFNIYNIEAAVSVVLQLGLPTETIRQAVSSFKSVFGRTEQIRIGTNELTLFLIKNPVGFDQIIHLLKTAEPSYELVIGINDNFADGTDISWLWDVDIEAIPAHIKHITTTGTRANEMALRLKYANRDQSAVAVEPNLESLVSTIEKNHEPTRTYILLTYTTMLQFRTLLAQRGFVKPFHED